MKKRFTPLLFGAFIILLTALPCEGSPRATYHLRPVDSCRYLMQFSLIEESYLEFPQSTEVSSLSISDLVRAEKIREEKRVQICLSANGAYTAQIELLNPEEVYASWMLPVIKTVITESDISFYDGANRLLYTEPHDTAILGNHSIFPILAVEGFRDFPRFDPVPQQTMEALEGMGYIVTALPNGSIEVRNATRRTLYDPARLLLLYEQINEGQVIRSVERRFTRTSGDTIVPRSSTYREPVVLASGVCATQIISQTYTEVSRSEFVSQARMLPIEDNAGAWSDKAISQRSVKKSIVLASKKLEYGEIEATPNPVSTTLNIGLPPRADASTYIITLVDLNGKKVRELGQAVAGGMLSVDIRDLTPGLYLIQARNTHETLIKKFIKQQ